MGDFRWVSEIVRLLVILWLQFGACELVVGQVVVTGCFMDFAVIGIIRKSRCSLFLYCPIVSLPLFWNKYRVADFRLNLLFIFSTFSSFSNSFFLFCIPVVFLSFSSFIRPSDLPIHHLSRITTGSPFLP